MMQAAAADLRYALRGLRRRPSFTAVVVLTLGVAVGLITAAFAVVDAVVLRPIVPGQDRVVRIWHQDVERGGFRHSLTYREFTTFRDEARSFTTLAAIQVGDASTVAITLDGQPTAVAMTPVSSEFFRLVDAGQPILGRWFQPADEVNGAELVGVVSERFWRRAAASDPAFVGRRLQLTAGTAAGIAGGARTLLVIGVAPPDLEFPLGTDVWVPIAGFYDGDSGRFDFEDRRFAQFELLGRLAPGASADSAGAELEVLARELSRQFPDDYRPMRVVVQPLLDSIVGNTRQVLTFLLLAAGLVLVVAGVNVAALLLIRAAGRRRELAVRIALGASRGRVARQMASESLLLGALAVVAGVLFARSFLGIVRWLAPADVPRIEHAALDLRVLGFCIAAVAAWVLTLGSAPVWAHRTGEPLRAGELSFRGRPRTAGLRLLTAAQIAAAVVVAIGAGLLVRSFLGLQSIDRGFDPRNLVAMSVLPPEGRYPDPAARVRFYAQLLPQVEAIPGVVAATPVHMRPGSGTEGLSAPMRFDGQTPEEAAANPWATWEPVTPSYFRTFGVAIVQGRALDDTDTAAAAPVAVVSESVARRYWPGENPIGKRLQLASEFPWVTVVGVARDLRYRELTKNWLTVYFPAAQFFFFGPTVLVVRAASDPGALVPAIRERIRSQEPNVVFNWFSTMEDLLGRELSRPRTAFTVTSLFALVAILLAAIGIYSVMAYEVTHRRHELALRSALGASPGRILRDVLARALGVAFAGAAVGLLTASIVTRSLQSLLYEVRPGDPLMFASGAGLLLLVVVLASSFPARRAAAADPAAVLRAE